MTENLFRKKLYNIMKNNLIIEMNNNKIYHIKDFMPKNVSTESNINHNNNFLPLGNLVPKQKVMAFYGTFDFYFVNDNLKLFNKKEDVIKSDFFDNEDLIKEIYFKNEEERNRN